VVIHDKEVYQVNTTTETVTIRPATAEDVAAALKRASDARQSMVIRGAGTKMDWGRPPARVDVVLDMRGLNRILAHEHGDLTATIEAGATLRDVNAALARQGQWLPLDPPFADRATIGGLLASNDSGPLRHRFGTPRDLVIGIRLATTDGVLSKAGGQVVKNVAGYDLAKLVTGSFGSLAAIVSATFKLSPLPAAAKTVLIEAPDVETLESIVRAVMGSQLEPIAFEVETQRSTQRPQSAQSTKISADSAISALRVPQGIPSLSRDAFNVLLRFASLPAVVDAQIEQTQALISPTIKGLGAPKPDQREGRGPANTRVIDGDEERTFWREHATRVWEEPGAIVRASWLPAELAALLGAVEVAAAQARCAPPTLVGRAAVGSGLVRIDGDDASQARAIDALRRSRHLGNIVIVRGSPALKALVDVWGSMGDRRQLLDSLKRAFDPNGVLNAERGPL
jgi:glycolate oxidase FAD binding subunit